MSEERLEEALQTLNNPLKGGADVIICVGGVIAARGRLITEYSGWIKSYSKGLLDPREHIAIVTEDGTLLIYHKGSGYRAVLNSSKEIT